MRRRGRQLLAGTVALVTALLLGACVQLPDDGPVVEADIGSERDSERASDIDAAPPEIGASRVEIVDGFLEAMMAWPIETSVAKEFLTDDAAAEWRPERTIVYSDLQTPGEVGSTVSVGLTDAAYLDESGAWRGAAPPSLSTLDFRLTVEDGEFRILNPVDALVVRSSWFERRHRQMSVYYFDTTARHLVPEPVFVPTSDQVATSLVSALLGGPPPRLRGVVRTFVPPLNAGLSVPVSSEGVATVDLLGGAPDALPDQAELMLVQLAATLRQVPEVTSVRVTVGGEEIAAGPGTSEYDVDRVSAYDVTADTPSGVLYGTQRGRLVTAGPGQLEQVTGPMGREPRLLDAVAVSPDAERVAAVAGSGQQVLLSPLWAPETAGVRVLVGDGTDLARPAWDASGRLWLLDRTVRGARVLVASAQGLREIRVPGITGQPARELLVSRDGTRLIALMKGAGGDRLVAARIVIGSNGRVQRVIRPTEIWSEPDYRVTDVVWTGPVQMAVLTPARPGELYEVETVSVDGASVGVDTLSSMVSGRIVGLAGEPSPDGAVYAVARDSLVDIRTGERSSLPARVDDLDYPG